MKLIIDREALKRKILEDDHDGDVEAGDPRLLQAFINAARREVAAGNDDEAAGVKDGI
ncbi:hypothetical protein G6L37_02735 [Agrobacterium rubi]|nr:hypothetical protein [Agrobacterium rubi]NTF24302.1 hypothetical protein [Agrobacterium rubi]